MPKIAPEDFSCEIKDFIGVLKESDKHDWCKAVAKISWNGRPATLDIRNINMAKGEARKGISLTDEEADRLTDILLENDYGSLEAIKEALDRKRSRFTIMNQASNCFDDNEKYVINISL